MHTVATPCALWGWFLDGVVVDDDDDDDRADDDDDDDDDDEVKLLLWSGCRTLGNHFLSMSILEIATTPIPRTATDISNMVQIWKLKIYCYNWYQILPKKTTKQIIKYRTDKMEWGGPHIVWKVKTVCMCSTHCLQMRLKMIIVGATKQAVRGKRIITCLVHWCRFSRQSCCYCYERGTGGMLCTCVPVCDVVHTH